ncbi:MAG: hypothetical protein HKN03_04125 [Acidimicrobiales bacterium]|nr:hypothetical protein [Acidimicrobiia bacterium]NNF53612.1 hypothetical protein [Acidimicrobiales bacterium]
MTFNDAPGNDMFGGEEFFSDLGTSEALAATRPWVRFMAIVAYIGTAFVVLSALVVVVASATQDGGGAMFLGLVYLLLAATYFFVARHLMAYATGISAYLASSRVADLNRALKAQTSFWRLVGILTIIGFVFGIFAALLSIFVLTAFTESFS